LRRPRAFGPRGRPLNAGVRCHAAHVEKADSTVWKAEVPSPDGRWVALAETIQNGGFGSAHIDTDVYVRRIVSKDAPQMVLGLSCLGPVPHPYTLDNTANHGGTVELQVRWKDASHLHINYKSHPDVYFYVVRYQGLVVSAEGLAN
jgi:hypothetical protein